jgi:Leucine-rich repeat (LRR) protein
VNLKHIELKDNQLRSLPSSIAHLVNLKELDLTLNQVTSIPDYIESPRTLIVKLKFEKTKELELARYYPPIVLDLDDLRLKMPHLSIDDDEAIKQCKSDPSALMSFIKFIHQINESETVKALKGQIMERSVEDIEIFSFYDGGDTHRNLDKNDDFSDDEPPIKN